MKRSFFTFLIICSLISASFGQKSYIKGRWNIKAGYARYKTQFLFGINTVNNNNYRLELNYGLGNKIETGVYTGYSRFMIYEPWTSGPPGSFVGRDAKAYFYGVNCNYHLLPLLIKEDDFRFDLYLTTKPGVLFIERNGSRPEYSIGGGAAFYIFRHIGAFIEYSYGKFYFNDNLKLRFGLSIKFREVIKTSAGPSK